MPLVDGIAPLQTDLAAVAALGISYTQLAQLIRSAIGITISQRGLTVTYGTGGFSATVSLEQARTLLQFCEEQAAREGGIPFATYDLELA